MHSIILTGVHDYEPRLAICHTGAELRGILTRWFGELVPDIDFANAGPDEIAGEIEIAMEPSDWTALACFPLTEDDFAFTSESIGIGLALACLA